MYPLVLFQNRKPDRPASLEEYQLSGGYQALSDVLVNYSPKEVQQVVSDSKLVGRGGAAFPTGTKWMAVADDASFPRYVVCNADEMEPGTFKDRALLHADPHMIIEGIIIAGYAVRAEKGIVFIRPEYERAAEIFEREIKVATEAGYLGKNILGNGYSLDIVVHRSGGRYVCGEVTAQMNAIEGKRANPKQPPPYPTEKGLWGHPTVFQNVETFACVPHILRNGSEWFKDLAKTETGAGTKIFCISGKVNQPGCVELPMGISLREIIEDHAGGMRPGSEFKACLPGGASTRFLPGEFYDIAMDFESFHAVGQRLGTGAIMVFDQKTCLVAATLNLIEFFVRESCGWCTPCREGLPYMRDLLWRIEEGKGEEHFIPLLERMTKNLWNAYCAFAPGAASPVESLLTYFGDEVLEHIRTKKCPFNGSKGQSAEHRA
jgi:NADH-quinone oxidoreductase subunit F